MRTVVSPLQSGDRGTPVRNLHEALILFFEKRLIESPQDGDNFQQRFRSEAQAAQFGDATSRAVSLFQDEEGLRTTGTVDGPTAELMTRLLRELNVVDGDAPTSVFTVSGRVTSATRIGVHGLRIAIVDKGIAGSRDVPLGDATTDAAGNYRATFVRSSRTRNETRPDLQARAFSGATFLGASTVRYDASPREILDIRLNAAASASLPSEVETLLGDIGRYYSGPLRQLQQTDDRQDITDLAHKTGWDARAVALAALADQFSARSITGDGASPLEPPFFYAIFRAGCPADEAAVYRLTRDEAIAIWKDAIGRGVLSSALQSRLDEAGDRFQRLVVQRLLDGPAQAGLSPLKELLHLSLGNAPTRHRRFAELQAQHRTEPSKLWDAVRSELGHEAERRLRLDGQLAYLTLNNAPLIRRLHERAGADGLRTAVQLAEQGYYRSETWGPLLANADVPPEIAGASLDERRSRYAEVLAAHVRLSFPTMVVAQMVREDATPVAPALRDQIGSFLSEHQDRFDLGMQAVQRYAARHAPHVPAEVVREIARIQRVYQITPSDRAMNALLRRRVDSALAVSRYDREEFVRTFKEDLGGETGARMTHAKAQQVHNIVLNLATSYLVARTAPQIGVHSPPKYGKTIPAPIAKGMETISSNKPSDIYKWLIGQWANESPDNAADVIPYATLEALFGEMDFCACDHCRSVLSPAAYLVDLLQFLDRGMPVDKNPLNIFLERRPDVEHLPLTCENTNYLLPYIDLVNETLEYFVTHNLTLKDYTGHSTDGTIASAELLATPQYVEDKAYQILAGHHGPNEPLPLLPPTSPLPFHQPLENLRRCFAKFEVPLAEAMEVLRTHDELERPAPADPQNPIEYGWRDILMEELRLSRAEYRLLTDRQVPLQQLYGFETGELENEILHGRPAAPPDKPAWPGLSNARSFARLMGLTYEDLVQILKTRFVNPHSTLVPKLERLGVPFTKLKALKDGVLPDSEFDALVTHVDPAEFGGDMKAWVKNDANYARIMSLITLVDPTGEEDACSFEKIEFRYANPIPVNQLREFEFHRLGRFVRIWKKLGWSIELTDQTIAALYPQSQTPDTSDDAQNLQRLDQGFLTLLPRLGVLKQLMRRLKLKPKTDLLPLLACFAPIDTHGAGSLYRQMFLSPAPVDEASPFADDGFGNFLTTDAKLLDHREALRAAFLLTDDELNQIVEALGYDANTLLRVDTISAIFRRGWLARKLKVSTRELLLLMNATGLDPFAAPDPPLPPVARLIDILGRFRSVGLKPALALYALWNRDVSGKSTPPLHEILELTKLLRAAFAAVETEFAIADDPTGQNARARMALVYGNEATDLFFGLLDNTFVTDLPYDHHQETLEPAILQAASNRIAYDDLAKRLSYTGVMTVAARDALLAATTDAAFQDAVHTTDPQKESLFARNQKVVGPFFDRYPELQPLYELHVFFSDPQSPAEIQSFFADFSQHYPGVIVNQSGYIAAAGSQPALRTLFLESFLPHLKRRRKRQQALATVAAAAKVEVPLASALLHDPLVLNPAAAASAEDSALEDLVAVQTTGLAARVYAGPAIGGANATPAYESDAEPGLAYPPSGAGGLSVNPASGIWEGYLEAPENGFYNFRVDPGGPGGPGATSAALILGSEEQPLAKDGEVWSNAAAIELRAGTLYRIELRVENLTHGLRIRWQTTGRGWETVPQRYLYSERLIDRLRTTYVRFLKGSSLATALKLTPHELTHFASHQSYSIGGRGWLNSIAVAGSGPLPVSKQLLAVGEALVDFASLKARLSPKDERLLLVLQDPTVVLETDAAAPEVDKSPLVALTRWDGGSLDALLVRFGKHQGQPPKADRTSLKDLATFVRIDRAYGPIRTIGVSAGSLAAVTTNEPQAAAVRAFKDALRARYEETDWLAVLKPINDEMRALQRDALVAYTLHHMRAHTGSAHIDTPEKLFEYFLMDVQMASCMQTSRIRYALSAVQLFAERCFMNLEPKVEPAVFEAKHRKQWEWMKRYRVWEVIRKIFLWCENDAHPELRLDASPFFKETMSELLQSDITEERAATALLTYLSKVEEVAKLEPCGMCFVEGQAGVADDVVHIVARTSGANRKYFYRKYDGVWGPFEPIKLDIEDDPVIPVVWKDRLLLFWLKIIKKVLAEVPTPPSQDLGMVDASALLPKEVPRVETQAILYCSEYFNGKWQSPRTSRIEDPLFIDRSPVGVFDRRDLSLWAEAEGEYLRLIVLRPTEGASYFQLFNLHSLPQGGQLVNYVHAFPRFLDTAGSAFSIDLTGTAGDDKDLLNTALNHRTVQPQHELQRPAMAPFFYGDDLHSFFVTPEKVYVPVHQSTSYGEVLSSFAKHVPLLVMKYSGPDTDGQQVLSNSPSVMERFVSEDAHIEKAIASRKTVAFGGVNIGVKGTAPMSIVQEG